MVGIEVALIRENRSNTMSKTTLDIEKQLSKLGKEIQQFVEKVVPASAEKGHFDPSCDIIEGDNEFAIYMDLPGLTKKMIRLVIKNRVLTISGERELYSGGEFTFKRSERRQGSFSRSFALPDEADESTVNAKFKDGVLQITLSKTDKEEEDEAQSIPIK